MYETNYQMPVMSRKDQALRNFFSQPKVLWLSIIGFISAVLSSFAGLIPSEPVDLSGFAELGIDVSSFEQYLSSNPTVSINIVPVLTAVAFLLFYLNAKNPQKGFKGPATILNVLAIIGFVAICIISVLCVVVLGLVAVFSLANTTSDDATFSAIILGIALFLLIIVFAISLLVAYLQMSFTKSLKVSTTTQQLSIKGVKGFGVITMLNGIIMAFSAITAFTPTITGFNLFATIFYFVQVAVGFAYCLLYYQFISGFGKIIEAEEATRRFESAPYNQAPVTNQSPYSHIPHSEVPVTGEAFDNQRPLYNNPYTTPQEAQAEVINANLCKNCGNPVNDDDYFCMKCGTRIERD